MADHPFRGHPIRRVPLPRRDANFPDANEIAERAYQLFVTDGRRLDRVADYWNSAEDELLDRAVRQAMRR